MIEWDNQGKAKDYGIRKPVCDRSHRSRSPWPSSANGHTLGQVKSQRFHQSRRLLKLYMCLSVCCCGFLQGKPVKRKQGKHRKYKWLGDVSVLSVCALDTCLYTTLV